MNRPSMPTPTPFLPAAAALAAPIEVTSTAMTIDAGSCTDAENDITMADLPGGDGNTSLLGRCSSTGSPPPATWGDRP